MSKFVKLSQQAETEADRSQDKQIMQTMISYAPKMNPDSFMKGIFDISKMPSKNPQEIQAKQNALQNFVNNANKDLANFSNYLTKLGIKL